MAAKPRSAIIVGILAVAIAVFASISLYNYLKGQEEKVKQAVATETIIIAAKQIPGGSTIDSSMVKDADWPKANLPQGSFSSQENVTGRRARAIFVPGEPIVDAKLVPEGGVGGILTYKIPEGHRAMTVGVGQVAGVAGFITPGDKVDVVLTLTPLGSKETVSKIVLQNVPILATGQILEQQPEGQPIVVPTVTMDVTPEIAEKLAIASTQGRLQLVLRGADDTKVSKTVGATVTKVMLGVEKPKRKFAARRRVVRKAKVEKKPVKEEQKFVLLTVDVWRGNKKTTETFKVEIQ
jgi:pilus assembly protein CpaB